MSLWLESWVLCSLLGPGSRCSGATLRETRMCQCLALPVASVPLTCSVTHCIGAQTLFTHGPGSCPLPLHPIPFRGQHPHGSISLFVHPRVQDLFTPILPFQVPLTHSTGTSCRICFLSQDPLPSHTPRSTLLPPQYRIFSPLPVAFRVRSTDITQCSFPLLPKCKINLLPIQSAPQIKAQGVELAWSHHCFSGCSPSWWCLPGAMMPPAVIRQQLPLGWEGYITLASATSSWHHKHHFCSSSASCVH